MTLKPGTFITVRTNQELSSKHNAVGDTFSGTLSQPVVLDGIVAAQRGQMVYGRVVEAQKVKGVSRLGIELTSLTLSDGSQLTIHTQLISRQGPTTPGGEQAGVITSTAAGGAMIGAIAEGGTGAAAGAGIGAAAGIIGVLVTRNHPSVIYPETMLTFQTEGTANISTTVSAGAFRYVGPDDYAQPSTQVVQRQPRRRTIVVGGGYYPVLLRPLLRSLLGSGLGLGSVGIHRRGLRPRPFWRAPRAVSSAENSGGGRRAAP